MRFVLNDSDVKDAIRAYVCKRFGVSPEQTRDDIFIAKEYASVQATIDLKREDDEEAEF